MKGKIAALILGICLLFAFLPIGFVLATSSKAQLKQYVSDLQNDPHNQELREKIINMVLTMKSKPETPDEYVIAKRKAIAMFKNAENQHDFQNAVEAFRQAALLAPWKAEIYYNLGLAEEKAGMPKPAIDDFKLYLIANPHAKDKEEVLGKIGDVEAVVEKAESFEGIWTDCKKPQEHLSITKNSNAQYEVYFFSDASNVKEYWEKVWIEKDLRILHFFCDEKCDSRLKPGDSANSYLFITNEGRGLEGGCEIKKAGGDPLSGVTYDLCYQRSK